MMSTKFAQVDASAKTARSPTYKELASIGGFSNIK
jgi:hypothetical protein